MLRPKSVINSEDYRQKLLPSQLRHSELSDTLRSKKLSQKRCGDAHSAEVLSHLRSELQNYHLHAEGQSDEFQQSQEKLRRYLERSTTEGVQFRSPNEENRTATAGIEPQANRL